MKAHPCDYSVVFEGISRPLLVCTPTFTVQLLLPFLRRPLLPLSWLPNRESRLSITASIWQGACLYARYINRVALSTLNIDVTDLGSAEESRFPS